MPPAAWGVSRHDEGASYVSRERALTKTRNITVFMGTRPEAVKLAPVVAALRASNDFRCTVVATGQHKEMFRQVASTFGFEVDADLDVFYVVLLQ